jgi:hypothetical protein
MNRRTMATLDTMVAQGTINGYALYIDLEDGEGKRWYQAAPAPLHALTFDEVEALGEDGTLRTPPDVGINIW